MPINAGNASRGASRREQRAARELAGTPVIDPYRGQLHDPFESNEPGPPSANGEPDAGRPSSVTEPDHGTALLPTPPWYSGAGLRQSAPRPAVAAGILALILGLFTALFGFALLAVVTLAHTLDGVGDRSFYQGEDATYVVLALFDFALAAAGVLGGIALTSGRLIGRIWVTVFGASTLALSFYWWNNTGVTVVIPIIVAIVSAVILVLSYQPTVTRWLGVLPPPQPE
jgi:hypothetical protein